MGKIIGVSGPIVEVDTLGEPVKLLEVAKVGDLGLIGEVVAVKGAKAVVQVYEDTTGLKLADEVKFTGQMLQAVLGPGLLGTIYDGIERPLKKMGERIERGVSEFALDKNKLWHFVPMVSEGEFVKEGQKIGYVQEGNLKHFILVPPKIFGEVNYIAAEGDYTVEQTVAVVGDSQLKMFQKWPVRFPRPIKKRLRPEIPLITGQRIIDFLLPMAKGGTGAIPGGFGTGKTVLQQTLAKWCDADIIVYIGCGERGNEMTEVLEEFPELEDPRTGKKLIERTILIANTSNMPVSARESSIYLGITIAEYFRDMGYHVALMADSTSRWAEAMRELSTRMGELPIEEGFPAYLSARIASIYERAGLVQTLSQEHGSLTVVGAVSPPGGDFSEPVTRHTRRFTSVFWALDKELANARFYPSINYTMSYSAYGESVKKWWAKIDQDWYSLRAWMMNLLQEDEKLQRIVKLLGTEALPEDQKLTVEIASLVKETFLQQNAFDPIDAYCPPDRQIKMAKVLRQLYDWWSRCLSEKGIPVKVLRSQPVVSDVARIRFQPDLLEGLLQRIIKTYEELLNNYGG